VKVKWNNPEASWLEGIFSRGDRRLTKVLLEAWQQGARFDSWSEHLNIDTWKKAFKKCNLDTNFYLLREREHDEILPWDHINSGISKEFLMSEWQKAMEGKKIVRTVESVATLTFLQCYLIPGAPWKKRKG
jgi:hypothetical protein